MQTLIKKIDNNNNAHGPILTAFSLDITSGYMAYEANEDIPGIVMFEAGLNGGTLSPIYTKVDYINGSNNGAFPDVDTPGWIAVDQKGMAWVPSTNSGEVGNTIISWKDGLDKSNPSEAPGPASYSTASDGNSNIWLTTDTGAATLEEIAAGSTSVTATMTGGGMNGPFKLSVDGGNTIWMANYGANTVSAWSSTGNAWLATNGFSTSAASDTGAVVVGVDGSGNVWTGNADGSVTQLLGLATPTATPFYGGVTVTTVMAATRPQWSRTATSGRNRSPSCLHRPALKTNGSRRQPTPDATRWRLCGRDRCRTAAQSWGRISDRIGGDPYAMQTNGQGEVEHRSCRPETLSRHRLLARFRTY